ncbi:alpha/beta hydrolase [Streptomyces sp. NBC_01210]|uniref:alpha/beta hydrolase n=1 Tax=Streptomyces sp. NBC_01210 TaxID=2903774 RepID=UPI002E140CF1|nr:alpha/beta hydrolase [Streptomyces sp. NBC_01210]
MSKNSKALRAGALSATAAVIATAVAGGAGNASSTPSDSAPATRKPPSSLTAQKLSWHTCAAPTPAQGTSEAPGGAWQCATLKAPLDYAKPDGETINVALIRAKAKDQDRRIGSLLFNFGGPGASGVSILPSLGNEFQTLNSRYDLVSFDPRGVGESSGVTCLSDKEIDAYYAGDGSPNDATRLKDAAEFGKKYIQGCERNSGKVLSHVDTVSAARDMDLMREVLGDKKLYYFGMSYGTELGGVYAHLFPKNVGRSVLDAVVDPTQDPLQETLGQAKGFQLALNNYMKDCAATKGPACPTGKGGDEGSQKLAALLKKIDKQPLPTQDGRKLTSDLAFTGIMSALYSTAYWPTLTTALDEALVLGQGNGLLALADAYNGRDEQGHYTNADNANIAISCADQKQRYTDGDVQASLPQFRKASPVFGEAMAGSITSCTGWPVTGKTDKPQVSAKGSAPILVIGNTGDPATPYEGAHKMAQELGDGVGVEITLTGQGHGGYDSGNSCLKKAVDRYLLDGIVPAPGTTCS